MPGERPTINPEEPVDDLSRYALLFDRNPAPIRGARAGTGYIPALTPAMYRERLRLQSRYGNKSPIAGLRLVIASWTRRWGRLGSTKYGHQPSPITMTEVPILNFATKPR